jgi:hypothetical protein
MLETPAVAALAAGGQSRRSSGTALAMRGRAFAELAELAQKTGCHSDRVVRDRLSDLLLLRVVAVAEDGGTRQHDSESDGGTRHPSLGKRGVRHHRLRPRPPSPQPLDRPARHRQSGIRQPPPPLPEGHCRVPGSPGPIGHRRPDLLIADPVEFGFHRGESSSHPSAGREIPFEREARSMPYIVRTS